MAEDKNITQLEKVSQLKDDALIYGVQDSRDVAIPANLLKADYFVTTGLTALTELSTSQQIAKAIGSFEGLKNAINATIPVFEETADKGIVIFEYGSISDENANEIIELVFYYYKDFHKIRIKKSVSGTLSLERLKTGLLSENNITNDEEDTGENKVPGLPLVKNISVKINDNIAAVNLLQYSRIIYLQDFITSDLAISSGNVGDKWYLTDTKQIREITKVSEVGAVTTTDYVPDGKLIYSNIKENFKQYRFLVSSGMDELKFSTVLGETEGTAYEGSKGKANADAITLINRSNTVYLQGNATSDLLISGGNLHDKWYLTDTKKIREIVGFSGPAKSPITEDYAPIDNSLYIYKNDPANIYHFSPDNGMYLLEGKEGKSAYQSPISGGYMGTESEFNEALSKMGNGIQQSDIVITRKDHKVGIYEGEEGTQHDIYECAFALTELPTAANSTKEYELSSEPLGFGKYLHVIGLEMVSDDGNTFFYGNYCRKGTTY